MTRHLGAWLRREREGRLWTRAEIARRLMITITITVTAGDGVKAQDEIQMFPPASVAEVVVSFLVAFGVN